MGILEKLYNIQQELKAPKTQRNNFGNYNYRNCEDILEAVKPLLNKYKCIIKLDDDLVNIGERYYVKSTATLIDTELNSEELKLMSQGVNITSVFNSAFAREEETKKGMDGSQITGASSSYARKYALNGLLAIDDTKDSDTTNVGSPIKEEYKCSKCGTEFKDIDYNGQHYTAKQLYEASKVKNGGIAICKQCLNK